MHPLAPLAFITTMVAAVVPQPITYVTSSRCSVRTLRDNPAGYRYTVDQVREAVAQAGVVVRAIAVDTAKMTWPAEYPYSSTSRTVEFRVLESLRGSEVGERLIIAGVVVNADDFNTGSVPYTMIRPSGQRGSCFTNEYRLGAEYLLMMTVRNGRLTPNWMALAPMNEQITGSTDPWLAWVRDEISGSRQPTR